jgi:hypothetical protein
MDCAACRRRLGKRATHYLLDNQRVVCGACLNIPRLHATFFPACPKEWHDMHDHHNKMGTPAGIACALGNWP